MLFFLLSYPDLQSAVADLTLLVNGGRFRHLDGRTVARQGGGFTYNVEAGAFYDAPNAPSETELLDGLKFASRTARTMTFAEYYRRAVDFTPAAYLLPHPWLYLCLPASGFMQYATGIIATPAEVAFANPRFSVWRRSGMKRPLARVPDGELVYRFQLGRVPPASADIAALVAMNRALYERAQDLGGTRMTSSAIPFSQADWIRHYGPAWKPFAAAKERYDPGNVLTPGRECSVPTAPEPRERVSGAPLRDTHDGVDAAVDVGLGGGPGGDADAHGGLTLPHGAAHPARALPLHRFDDLAGALRAPEGYQHLIQADVVQHRESVGSDALGESRGQPAAALDEVHDTSPAERAEGRPHLDAARPARKLRDQEPAVPALALREIGRARRHGRPERPRLAHDCESRVVGDVQPLVGVRRPRVREGGALGE